MRVLVKDLNQNLLFKINVKCSDTIIKIKDNIKENIQDYDIGDPKLIFSGNILADDSTVEECGLDEQDYVTLVYKGETVIDSEIEKSERSSQPADTENTESSFNLDDSKFVDTSRNAFLASIPNGENLCEIMSQNPVELSKLLSKLGRNGPSVFESILSKKELFINLLNIGEYINAGDEIVDLDTQGHEAIDRLVDKGFDKDLAVQAYQACDLNENFAAELLYALKSDQ